MKSDLLYALSKGRLKTAVSGLSGFYYFRLLQLIGSVSEILVRFPVSGSVHKFPAWFILEIGAWRLEIVIVKT